MSDVNRETTTMIKTQMAEMGGVDPDDIDIRICLLGYETTWQAEAIDQRGNAGSILANATDPLEALFSLSSEVDRRWLDYTGKE